MFFVDFTVRELTLNCPELRELLILEPNNRFILGKSFLCHLEVPVLSLCMNVCRLHLLKICKELKLKAFNIPEIILQKYAPFLRQILSLQFTSLRQLWLTAIANQLATSSILTPPHSEILKFYRLNDHVRFEKLLFTELPLRNRILTHEPRICNKFQDIRIATVGLQ